SGKYEKVINEEAKQDQRSRQTAQLSEEEASTSFVPIQDEQLPVLSGFETPELTSSTTDASAIEDSQQYDASVDSRNNDSPKKTKKKKKGKKNRKGQEKTTEVADVADVAGGKAVLHEEVIVAHDPQVVSFAQDKQLPDAVPQISQ